MSTVRARFDGKVFVPETAVQLPVGEVVEIAVPDSMGPPRGSPAAILKAINELPQVRPEDVDEMERYIEEGTSKATFEGIFDDLRDADGPSSNGT